MMGLRFHFCFLVLCASLILPTQCLAHTCLPEDHVALFIFGDSFFDAGNNNYINTSTDYQYNVWPYGETFFKYPTGRPSDGRLIPDFIGNIQSWVSFFGNIILAQLTFETLLQLSMQSCH
jgi:hypothetical protein